jgi:hypothetical protein
MHARDWRGDYRRHFNGRTPLQSRPRPAASSRLALVARFALKAVA